LRRALLAAGALIGLLSVAGSTPAAAAELTEFKVKPASLSSAGGEVAFSAKLPGVATCTMAVSPSYGGLPSPFPCGEAVQWRYVVVPPDTTAATATYKYTATAKYADGTTLTSKAVTVTVAPSPATTYVALGDSYSAGEGNPGKAPKSWVDRAGKGSEVLNGCDRSAVGYPMLLGKWLPTQTSLPPMSLRFLACSGATTEDVWNSGSHSAHGLAPANNIEWQQVQDTTDLAKARIVTVTIGGNDLDFSDVLTNCVLGPPLHYCNASSNDGWIGKLQQNIGTLEPILRETYEEIEARAPKAALYVVGYPDLFPGNASLAHQVACSAATEITEEGVKYLIENQGRLTAEVETAAKEAGAHFVNPNYTGKNGFWGHDVCAASAWFNGINLVDPQYSFHPNKTGQKALAENVKAAIQADSSVTEPPGTASTITAGYGYSCATTIGATAWCWGENNNGQLGNGTNIGSLAAVPVSGLTSATKLAAGWYHTCALLSGGTVECWGENINGQLGTGNEAPSTVPHPVTALTEAIGVAVGIAYSCAALNAGTVKCWGNDSFGQLGAEKVPIRQGYPESDVPIEVTGISTAVAISSAASDTCAVLSSGTIDCWGENGYGQLGDGTTETRFTPVQVVGITNAVAVSAGSTHTCALLSDGTVRCWGSNQGGQLGDGTTTASYTPVAVGGLTGVTGVATGGVHTCALLGDGSMRCWGLDGNGELGDGHSGSGAQSTIPVPAVGITNARAITAGTFHTCAVLAGGAAKCWGANFAGQLGDGTAIQELLPKRVLGLP
jgi:alpha-tubulin suppressor-like RCC1 family protein/lysophospholipase L1-like esterase